MSYKLSFNIPNNGKVSINLIKKINFLPSMCDGIHLSVRIPASTTTAELSFLCNHYSSINTDSWNALEIRLSEPVDEYITVNFDSPSFKDTIILYPGKTSAIGSKSISIDNIEYFKVKTYVYIGQRLVYSFTDNFKDFRNNYFGVRNYYPGSSPEGNITEPKEKLSLTTNNETIYVYPLCKFNDIKNEIKENEYFPCFKYKGEDYVTFVTLTTMTDNDFIYITQGLPENIEADDIKDEIAHIAQESFEGTDWGMTSTDENGNPFYKRNFRVQVVDENGNAYVKVVSTQVNVNPGETVREIPVKDENGNLIGYHLITVDGDGNITSKDSVSLDSDYNAENVEIITKGDVTYIKNEDGSITVNWGTNNPDGNNSNTYYPDEDGGWVDENGNSVDLPSDITGGGGDNSGEGGDDSGGDNGEGTGDGGDTGNPDSGNPDSGNGDSGDTGNSDSGNGDQSSDSGLDGGGE